MAGSGCHPPDDEAIASLRARIGTERKDAPKRLERRLEMDYKKPMNALLKTWIIGLVLIVLAPSAQAQTQSNTPADKNVSQNISKALVKAGIDPRTTSVQVITTSDHVVYLKGLISNQKTIKLAGDVAAKTAPSYRIVNQINSGFFDDQNHVNGGMSK
jgi:hypothetical protein